MASFKKNISINGTFKALAVAEDNCFLDLETGEMVDVAGIIKLAIGANQPFDLKVSQKDDVDITPAGE